MTGCCRFSDGPTMRRALVAGLCILLVAGRGSADTASQDLSAYHDRLDGAIDKALEYLASRQKKDGSFEGKMRNNVGVVSLAVMAFLAKGHTPGEGRYGQVITRGIDFVLDHQKDSGLIAAGSRSHGPMYGHGISTLLLSEVSGMVTPRRQAKIDRVLPRGLRLILAAQAVRKGRDHRGGWRYQHTSKDSDISCTGWQLMALRSARGNGARIPAEAIDRAVDYVLRCRHRSGGFCYMPGKTPGLARTGTALLCLELCGRHGEKPSRKAGDWILDHLPDKFGNDRFFYYGLYYCSQGMFQLGGKYWDGWARRMYEMMLAHQKDNGSWPAGTGNEANAGTTYSTAMAVLAMSVSYRQLPIYQR